MKIRQKVIKNPGLDTATIQPQGKATGDAQQVAKKAQKQPGQKAQTFDANGFAPDAAQTAAMKLIGGAGKGTQSRSKSTSSAITGLDLADKTPSMKSRLKKGVLALTTGLVLASSITPAVAQDMSAFNIQPQAQNEMTVAADFGQSALNSNFTISPWETRLAAFDTGAASVDATSDYSPAVQAQIDQAFSTFETRISDALTPSGLDFAKNPGGNVGFNALTGQGTATASQENAVKDALKDLFGDLPVAAFSEGAASQLTSFFTSRGVSGADLDGATLSDFGSAGGDLAKQMVEDFRDDKPVAFYSLATVLAGGAGAAAYFQGSDALDAIGLKPEVSAKIFNNTEVSLGASWDEKFSNPAVELGFNNVVDFDSPFRLTTNGTAYLSGTDFGSLDVDAWKLSSTFHADDNHTGISVYAQDANQSMHGLTEGFQVGTNAWYRTDDFRISGGADYNFDSDRFNAQISAEYEPNENLSIGVFGSHDSHGDSQIGIGGTFRF